MDLRSEVLTVFLISLSLSLVFMISYSVYPLAVVSDSQLIEKYLPVTYVLKSDPPLKLIVKVDRYQGFTCIQYWYYWNHDGFKLRDDYEPIFVYVKPSGEIHALALRIHYNWRVKFEPIAEGTHIVITFINTWHTPVNNYPFDLPNASLFIKYSLPYEVTNPPEDVNPWNIVTIEGYPSLKVLVKAVLISLASSSVVTCIYLSLIHI